METTEAEIEIWKDVLGYEGFYEVSSLGRVKSLTQGNRKGRFLKPSVYLNGYLHCGLYKVGIKKEKNIHQLVAIAFLGHIPNGQSLIVDHKNGDKHNCKVTNLQIVTTRENSSTCFRKNKDKYSSKYIGVGWDTWNKRWKSQIRINGKSKQLGSFKSEIEAAGAYQEALKNHLSLNLN